MKARVTVTLKNGILDPQGKAIEGALKSLGVGGIASVRQGKVFDIELEGADKARAEAALKEGRRQAAREYRDRELSRRGGGLTSATDRFVELAGLT
jgi:phosphoribosylformylglycinamidine synthase PurS subunit